LELHVLGRHHIAHEGKLVAIPYLFLRRHKKISCTGCAQRLLSPMATKRNEMQMPVAINPKQFVSHVSSLKNRRKPAPLNSKGCGTHSKAEQVTVR